MRPAGNPVLSAEQGSVKPPERNRHEKSRPDRRQKDVKKPQTPIRPTRMGVTSEYSWYLTSIVYLSFYRFARPRFLLFSSLRNTVAQPVSFCTQRFGAPSYMRHCLLERSFSLAEMLFLWQRVGFRCRARASLRCCSFADHCRHGLHRLEPLTSGKDLMHVTHPLVWGSDI